jgi:alanine dehydrogenase
MLIQAGHDVLFEKNARRKSGYHDDQYSEAGARIVTIADDARASDMIIKVKEPIEAEYKYL